MVLVKFLLAATFAVSTSASALLRRDASPEDSITYCRPIANTSCTATPDPSSAPLVTLPENWYGHFECYVTVDGVDLYYAGHPPAAQDAQGLSKPCFAAATNLTKTGCDNLSSSQCLKASLANCCDWLTTNPGPPGFTIEGLQCSGAN